MDGWAGGRMNEFLVEGAEWGRCYLGGGGADGVPVQTRQDVVEEEGVVVDFGLLELGVFEVEGEGEGGGFAGFYGAGEEVDG